MYQNDCNNFLSVLRQRPKALAVVMGSNDYPGISGKVRFYQAPCGVLVYADIIGLPKASECAEPVFGFHIHSGNKCAGTAEDPFADAMSHYNPNNCPHPHHAGDMPPLFGNSGRALLIFLTDRFTVEEIIGKTVIIHSSPDDFTTQPSGNSGKKIACGKILLLP